MSDRDSDLDAYAFVSRTVESPLAQVCDMSGTRVTKLRKEWLPAPVRETHRGRRTYPRKTAPALSP